MTLNSCMWDGSVEALIPDPDILCQECEERPATGVDAAGDYWCDECLGEAVAGMYMLVSTVLATITSAET